MALRPLVASLFILTLTSRARGGEPPAPVAGHLQFSSANGRFTAVLEPRTDRTPARLSVYEGDPGRAGATPVWEAELACPVAPRKVLVSDDGWHVVAFENWVRPGHGDDVVSVYLAGRQVASWPLERALLPAEMKGLGWYGGAGIWRRHAVDLLVDFNEHRYLCVWLGPPGRWKVWDLTAPRGVVAPSAPLAERYNALAREWAVAQLERPGGDHVAALQFLGSLRDARDRPLLEKALSAADDYRSSMHFFGEELHRCFGRSDTRKLADAALGALDGREPEAVVAGAAAKRRAGRIPELGRQRRELRRKVAEHYRLDADGADAGAEPLRAIDRIVAEQQAMLAQFLEQRDDERYVYLGVVDVDVRLPQRPGGKGSLWVYLVPENVAAADWAKVRPVQRLRVPFTDPPAGGWPATIPARFEGVTPGRYWVKAVWDCAEPFFGDVRAACAGSPGDLESVQRTVVNAVAGKVSGNNTLDCVKPFVER